MTQSLDKTKGLHFGALIQSIGLLVERRAVREERMPSLTVYQEVWCILLCIQAKMSANKKERSHEDCLVLICVCCGNKSLKCLKVTDAILPVIRKAVFKGYSTEVGCYPKGVCPYCRRLLYSAKKDGIKVISARVKATWNIDFNLLKPPSRCQKGRCDCTICNVVRFTEGKLESEQSIVLPRRVRNDETEDDSENLEAPTSSTRDDSNVEPSDESQSTKAFHNPGIEETANPSCDEDSAKPDAKVSALPTELSRDDANT